MKFITPLLLVSVFSLHVFAQETPSLTSWRDPLRKSVENKYIRYAEQLEAARVYSKAARVFGLGEKKAPTDAVAGYCALARADVLYARRKHFKALDAYKDAIARYPDHTDFAHAMDMLVLIAEDFAQNRTRGLFKGFRKTEARQLYRYMISQAPFGEKTGQAMLRLAELERDAGEIIEAMQTYRLCMKRFAGTQYARTAQVELAETFLNEAQETRDKSRLAESAKLYAERALRENPNDEEALRIKANVDQLFARHYYYLGQFYLIPAHYDAEAAQRYFALVKDEYPNSPEAKDAALQWALLVGRETPLPEVETPAPAETRQIPDPETVVPGMKIDADADPAAVAAEAKAKPTAEKNTDQPKKYLLPVEKLGIK